MFLLRITVAFIIVTAGLTSAGGVASANCGVDYCPLPNDPAQKTSLGAVQLLVRHVEFSLPDGEGSYIENLVRVEVRRFSNWNFGGWIAPIMLSVDGENRTGLSNPVLFAERREPVGERWRLLGGAQLEVPMGDSHNGIASGHSELLSYVGGTLDDRSIRVQIRVGLATALSKGHAHAGGNALLVNPHADTEAQVRASIVAPLREGKLQPGAFLTGRMVLMEDVEERSFLTGALGASYQVTKIARLQGQVEVPLTEAQRFDWRAGVGVGFVL